MTKFAIAASTIGATYFMSLIALFLSPHFTHQKGTGVKNVFTGLPCTQGALWLKYAVLLPKLFFFKVDSPAVWSNFLVQIYVNIQDLGLFGGSDPGTELDHLKEVKKHFKEWNSISASENTRDMVLFWGMGNHLGLFSEASDRPEGQELGGGAVGGQGGLKKWNRFRTTQSEASDTGLKWFPIPKTMVFDTKIQTLVCSETESIHRVTFAPLVPNFTQLYVQYVRATN